VAQPCRRPGIRDVKQALPSITRHPPLKIGLVGAGKGGSALLDLLLDWPEAKLAVVIDPRPETGAMRKARALGVPTGVHPLEVFSYDVNLVLEVTGKPAVLEDLLREKPAAVEVIGAGSLRFFWELLEDKVKTARQLQAQLDIVKALGSPLNLKQQLAIATQKLAQVSGADRCGLYLWNEAAGLVTPVMSQFATGEPNERMWSAFKGLGRLKLQDVPFLYEVIERRGPIEIADPASDPLVPPGWADLFEIKSMLVVPIFRENRVVGACSLDYCREPRRFTADQATLAIALAGQVALALENARLFEETRQRALEISTLHDIGTKLVSTLHLSAVLEEIAGSAIQLIGAQRCAVFELDPRDQRLHVRASRGMRPDQPFMPMKLGQGAAGSAALQRQPVFSPDVRAQPLPLYDEAWEEEGTTLREVVLRRGYRAILAVPLVSKETALGAICIYWDEIHAYDEREVQLLTALAQQAAVAIENARLYEETDRRRREAEELGRVSRTLSESLDVAAVGERIAESVLPLFGAEAAVVWLVQPDSSLVVLASSGPAGKLLARGYVFPPGVGLPAKAVAEDRPLWSSDVLSRDDLLLPDDLRQRLSEWGTAAVLAVPLRAKGKTIGALVIRGRTGWAFSEDEVVLLEAFAAQGALALENARLFDEVRRSYDDLRQAQEHLVRVERLRALGEMAAGVAHDFNNLLAVILGRSELLLARVSDADVARGLEIVCQAARDGAQTVRRIQEFTRTRRTRPFGRVDLVALLQEVVELTRPRWKDDAQSRGVSYAVDVQRGPVPPVAGISEELREVFINLLTNALEAMPAGGCVRFLGSSDAQEVIVSVEDTGCGMSEETRRRVFEPFFTTKGPRGTGLGLAVAWGIVTRHGGTIEVSSTLGVGTAFTVRLPIGREFPAEAPPEPSCLPTKPARVLVVDDEPEVRAVLDDLLTAQGHGILEAADGPAALALLETEPVDLVLSDLSMPGMSGWELAAVCQAKFPQVLVGLITGWGDQLDPDQLRGHGIQFVLAKPFVASEVRRQVSQVLNPTASTPG